KYLHTSLEFTHKNMQGTNTPRCCPNLIGEAVVTQPPYPHTDTDTHTHTDTHTLHTHHTTQKKLQLLQRNQYTHKQTYIDIDIKKVRKKQQCWHGGHMQLSLTDLKRRPHTQSMRKTRKREREREREGHYTHTHTHTQIER